MCKKLVSVIHVHNDILQFKSDNENLHTNICNTIQKLFLETGS